MIPIVLASTSPQRRELMTKLGAPFRIVAPKFEEHTDDSAAPGELAAELALGKARSVVEGHPGAVIVSADTVVVLGGRAVSKPASPDQAREFVQQQQSGPSTVITGMAVIDDRHGERVEQTFVSESLVRMRSMNDSEVDAYLASGEGLDKAGAMAVSIVESVDGDLDAVIGLPTRTLAEVFAEMGLPVRNPAA